MTMIEAAPPGDPTEAEIAPPRPRGRRPWLVPSIALAAVFAGVAWWHTHPTDFPGVGDTVKALPDSLQAVYVGMAWPPGDDPWGGVRLEGAQPRVEVFGMADAEVVMCSAPVGVLYEEDVGSSCGPIGSMAGSEWASLAVRVTPVEPRTVVVLDGIDVTYANDLQRGTQHTGVRGVVVFPASGS